MRSCLLLVPLALVACDAGAKPEPAKAAPGSAVQPATTDCTAVITVLHAAKYRAWIKEPPPPPVSESLRALGPACAKWPESVKACIVAGTTLEACGKQYPQLTDELLLLGFETAVPAPATDCKAAVAASTAQAKRHTRSDRFPDINADDLLDYLVPVYEKSCEEDGWPERYKACLVLSNSRKDPIECGRMLIGTDAERRLNARVHEAEDRYNATHEGSGT